VPVDVHALELLRSGQLLFASQVFKVFDFDWTNVPGSEGRTADRRVETWARGTAVLVWWSCDGEGKTNRSVVDRPEQTDVYPRD
jgi:hypothetical protein